MLVLCEVGGHRTALRKLRGVAGAAVRRRGGSGFLLLEVPTLGGVTSGVVRSKSEGGHIITECRVPAIQKIGSTLQGGH